MPTRRDKEGYWHVDLRIEGRKFHRRLRKGEGKREAETLEASLRTEFASRQIGYSSDPTMAEIMTLYAEHAANLRSPDTAIYHAERVAGIIDKYTASQARECGAAIVDELLDDYEPATINRSIGTIKKGLTLAWERGLTTVNYGGLIKRIPENNQRETFITLADVRKLASFASNRVAAAIWIAIYTGMRRGEIVALTATDITGDTLMVRSGNTKTLKTRSVPIIPKARKWLKMVPLGITAEGVKSGFQRARRDAGMEHVNFHDLRHSCASLLVQAGVDLYTIAKILGHSSTRTTERYAHMQVEQMRSAMVKTFGKTPPKTPPKKSASVKNAA